MDELRSWANDDATKFFSGVATYEKSFTAPSDLLKPGVSVQLDFGEARPEGADNGGQGAVPAAATVSARRSSRPCARRRWFM